MVSMVGENWMIPCPPGRMSAAFEFDGSPRVARNPILPFVQGARALFVLLPFSTRGPFEAHPSPPMRVIPRRRPAPRSLPAEAASSFAADFSSSAPPSAPPADHRDRPPRLREVRVRRRRGGPRRPPPLDRRRSTCTPPCVARAGTMPSRKCAPQVDTHVGLVARGWLDCLVFSMGLNFACPSTPTRGFCWVHNNMHKTNRTHL